MGKQSNKQLTILWFYIIVLAVCTGYVYFIYLKPTIPILDSKRAPEQQRTYQGLIKITSPAFSEGEQIPTKYTCQGEDVNPPLTISNIPNNAQSLVIIIEDPDALYKTFTHWIVMNISPKTTQILENSVPSGAMLGENDYGKLQYAGPCPTFGRHQYNFKIYALDTIIELQSGADRSIIDQTIKEHVLDSAQLTGYFEK